jgi:hypothetical protein
MTDAAGPRTAFARQECGQERPAASPREAIRLALA